MILVTWLGTVQQEVTEQLTVVAVVNHVTTVVTWVTSAAIALNRIQVGKNATDVVKVVTSAVTAPKGGLRHQGDLAVVVAVAVSVPTSVVPNATTAVILDTSVVNARKKTLVQNATTVAVSVT